LQKLWMRVRVPGAAAFAAPAAAAEPLQAPWRAWYAPLVRADESLKPRVVRLRVARLRVAQLRLKRHAALASRAAGGVSPPGACLRQPSVGGAASDARC
jgi:hypothetical protein